ncbi:MAG: choice-of-anchor Q domain-containing protein [Verrucomicrobiales bacterium]
MQTSLREAIAQSNQKPGDDLIVFSRGFNNSTNFYDAGAPKTIIAATGEFVITDGVEIDGPGAGLLTLSGDANLSGDPDFGDNRIFNFAGNEALELQPRSRLWGMTLATASPQITDQPGDGGAILNSAGVLEIFDTVFRDNEAQRGGAIFNSASLILFSVTLEDNEAFGEGGGIFSGQMFGGGTLYSYSSTFIGNRAARGGALFTQSGQTRIFNSTISSNDAIEGGGLYYADGDVQITNSTIAENSSVSDTAGGGIDLSGAISTPIFDLDNTIVAANTAGGPSPGPSDIGGVGLAISSFNNLISDASSTGGLTDGNNGNLVGIGGTGNLVLSDILEPIGDNGGPTQTYLPIEASPVVDSGDNQSAVFSSGGSPLGSDQRGLPRIVPDIVDIGSVEIQSDAPVLDPIGDIPPMFELELLRFTATATIPDGLAEPLFSLEDGDIGSVPPGASIDPITGDFEWTPDEPDGPGTFEFDVVVARDDNPDSTARETILVEVLELNEPPTLAPIANQTVEALSPLTFTATASDPDEPQNTLTFDLDTASLGLGMSINPTSGVFQWIPSSAQAPGIYPVTVSLSDDGAPPLTDSQSFSIQVTQGALPVVSLGAIGGAALHEPASYSKSPPATPPAASFRISRSGLLGGDFPVTLQITDLSQAAHGSDFQVRISGAPTQIAFSGDPLSATITIPDDEASVNLIIDAIDDAAAEADETITLAIVPQIDYVVGAGALVQVIAQNDFGVTNLDDFEPVADPDGGEGTLRRAVINAKAALQLPQMPPAPADITFDPALLGTIALTEGALEFDTADFSISGPGSSIVGVNAGLDSRVIVAYEPGSERSYRVSGLSIEEGATSRNGGGIFTSETLVLEDCTISGCLAENGGGISNEGELTMIGCLVTMNTAAVYGGGIDNFGGTSSVQRSTITGNSANFGGGIENSTSGTLRIESSTVAGNQATSSGGGIDSFTGTTSTSNLTVSGNRAGFGAGLFNEASSLTIVQSTVVGNIALSSGGGILASSNAPAGNTLMHNSIVAGNREGGETPSDIATGNSSFVPLDPTSSSNLIGDASSSGGLANATNNNLVGLDGSGLRPIGEIVSPLGDNGGPTATHALASASVAIDAGDNASALDTSGAALQHDQRGSGFARIVAGAVDIGAFEIEPALPKIVSCEVSAGPEATITWESESGEVYDVFCSSDLEHWLLVGSGIPSAGDLTSWTDTNPPSEQAYFIVRPAIDQ